MEDSKLLNILIDLEKKIEHTLILVLIVYKFYFGRSNLKIDNLHTNCTLKWFDFTTYYIISYRFNTIYIFNNVVLT